MIPSPFKYESRLPAEHYQKIGQLSLRWSHIDHTLGNSLRVMLRLTPEEAVPVVFSLASDLRYHRIRELKDLNPLSPAADFAFRELDAVMRGLQPVRNNVVHAILYWSHSDGELALHLRSKNRTYTLDQIIETEELTNYAAIAVLNLRYRIQEDDHDPDEIPPPLPDRPAVPEFLRSSIQWPKNP